MVINNGIYMANGSNKLNFLPHQMDSLPAELITLITANAKTRMALRQTSWRFYELKKITGKITGWSTNDKLVLIYETPTGIDCTICADKSFYFSQKSLIIHNGQQCFRLTHTKLSWSTEMYFAVYNDGFLQYAAPDSQNVVFGMFCDSVVKCVSGKKHYAFVKLW